MNVTNRRKSTDADTTPTIQTSHHHNLQQTPQNQLHHQPHLSYVSCRQAATATASSSNHHNHSSRQAEVLVVDAEEEDQEPIVTSTSADCCLVPLQAEGEGEEVTIDLDAGAITTSPARITSSTNNYDILNYSSTDSLSVEEEMVMPTTSENAARTERREETTASHRFKHRSGGIGGSNGTNVKDMVARDTTHTTVADAAAAAAVRDVGSGVGVLNDQAASTSNNSDGHKIILKLPKASVASESHVNADNEDDPRKVEPLKINLHNTHHHHNTHHTPKITIKPILKEPVTDASLVSSEECSSSAEDDIVSRINNSEPHIVPKLTIRAKNEDYGSSHTTVVPKLTIKINDPSAASTDCVGKTNAALNTPPLPKLTIKTGQDGQTESIITNVSPASSTNSSSSSLASCASTSLSSANSVLATPKVTIKTLHKTQDFLEQQQLPMIPKLCIKTNTLSTDGKLVEEAAATASKIPKLTIKTGQEHAVIITTQHNDNAKSSGGIPKMTIKTNAIESSAGDKIPKLTIKTTTNPPESIPKLCINKAQLEASLASSGPCLSPKQQPVVPKLTISRQAVQTERTVVEPVEVSNASSIPKMTIKTQSNKPPECVPKLSLKSLTKRPTSTKEIGKSDDAQDDPVKPAEFNKTVPKLTIKNVGSPQQKLTIVKDDINRKITSHIQPDAICEDGDFVSLNEDVDEFRDDVINVDNPGGESSNSQEFCGFNESAFTENKNAVEEYRRQSDDMDIDESLQNQHEPQIFQNPSHFADQSLRDSSSLNETELNGQTAISGFPKTAAQIIDTVDLTSSAGSSPAASRFEYNEDEEVEEEEVVMNETNQITEEESSSITINQTVPNTNILMERLQRETSVIRNTQTVITNQETNLLSPPPPPLQAKLPDLIHNACATSRYPQLMERLMTNGAATANMNMNAADYSQVSKANECSEENIIDSIEILDTPEGSPRASLDERPQQQVNAVHEKPVVPNGLHYPRELLEALNNNNSNLKRHAPPPMINNSLSGPGQSVDNLYELPSKLRKLQNDISSTGAKNHNELNKNVIVESSVVDATNYFKAAAAGAHVVQPPPPTSNHQRSRKQKHEHLLQLPSDEDVIDSMQVNSLDSLQHLTDMCINASESNTLANKRKTGRPRKSEMVATPNAKEETASQAADNKSRRVQLLRKRLAIDMVAAEQPLNIIDSIREIGETNLELKKNDEHEMWDTPRKERNLRTPLRTSRRSNTPTTLLNTESKQNAKSNKPSQPAVSHLAMENNTKKATKHETTSIGAENVLNHFLESNSSVASASTAQSKEMTATMVGIGMAVTSNSGCSISMATQIDLTMSSSSSNSNSSTTTNTVTTVEAPTTLSRIGSTNGSGQHSVNISVGGGGSSNNSMLPPTTILSSSDPLQDVIFRPNDFSSIIATQQLRGTVATNATVPQSLNLSMEEDAQDETTSGADNSEEDSASSSSLSNTTGRSGRGRGRGSRGGKAATGRAYRAHRLGRSASAVAKAIAVNRPKWVGALKHTPDPERIKGLFNPAPQVFEEDTRMSADMTQTPSMPQDAPPTTPTKQPDFLNTEESQSSVISNTSLLDPNNVVLATQNVSAIKKPVRKKKMEVCVSEDADFSVASIAEYEWPRPKGCCPSKNRDTFMIQEQVANYLGIKSFKRKYPDLPRRQVDMEERNWLQEQGLVSEKMCDLGITAVWASDILDIMYSDFYEKYEEYKDFVRQKHLREIETKQKSLGLNVAGRGLQARDRAMLNTSKWNSYFNKTRKEERLSCLDLQTLIVNKPSPASAPISTITYRPIAEAVALAAKLEHVPQPPTLLQPRIWEPIRCRDVYYPLSLVPGQFCGKYLDYAPEDLRRFPLNTVLSHHKHLWQQPDNDSNSSDTDSAVESIENDVENEASIASGSEILRKRRVRRLRTKLSTSKDEFKIPPIPGASASATSSNDSSSSSSDEMVASDTDSESSQSSASSEESSEDENSPATTCGVCLHSQNRNLRYLPEIFIQCYTCKRKVHPSCIEMPHKMSTRVRNYNWQCAECKCCIKCKGRQDQNKMLFCEQCDRGFHVYCLGVKSVPDGRWSCDRCRICMRCGATKPEGLPMAQQINNKHTRQKKLKWVNEYRVDHVTKIKEHCSIMCVPCGRTRTNKRVQIVTHNNTTLTYSGALSPNCSSSGQCSPAAINTNHTFANVTAVSTTNELTEAININNNAEETLKTPVAGTAIVSSSPSPNCSSSKTLADSSASTAAVGSGGPPPVVA